MKIQKNRDRTQKYICVGENFRNNASIGDCGEVKSLMDWMKHLSHRNEDELNTFFDASYTNNDIVNYIYSSWGKRLKVD